MDFGFAARDACCTGAPNDPQAGGPQASSHRALRRRPVNAQSLSCWTRIAAVRRFAMSGRLWSHLRQNPDRGEEVVAVPSRPAASIASGGAILNGFR